jgi:hypothetical protein
MPVHDADTDIGEVCRYSRDNGGFRMLEKLGGRKFLFGLLLELVATVFVLVGKMTTDQWVGFSEVVGSAYVLGNVAANAVEKLSARKENKTVTA